MHHNTKIYLRGFFFLVILTFSTGFLNANCVYTIELNVEAFEMGNMLTWSTASETNNKGFIVEKSTDNVNFTKIGQVKGAGNSTDKKDYRFLDVSASKGTTYYRLKQENFDNTFEYTNSIAVKKEDGNNFTVISMTPPSDEDNTFELTISVLQEEVMNYKIYKMNGELVYKQKQKLKKGINVISVDLSEISTATNNPLLGDTTGYKVTLEGLQEAETLTIAPRSKDKK